MKSLTIIPVLILFALFCKGQSSEIKIDYDFFLLGTLNDNMGREKYKEVDCRVDVYPQNSKSFVLFLDSVFKNKYPDLTVTTNKKTGLIELHSKLLSKKMNNFYSFDPSERMVYRGEADFDTLNLDSLTKTPDFYKTNFDTIYTGRIKSDIFKNSNQRLSFIAGAFIRFGGENDSLCFISLANSTSKVNVVEEQLKMLKCSNVEYVMKKVYTQVWHTVYFTPTDELGRYFSDIFKRVQNFEND